MFGAFCLPSSTRLQVFQNKVVLGSAKPSISPVVENRHVDCSPVDQDDPNPIAISHQCVDCARGLESEIVFRQRGLGAKLLTLEKQRMQVSGASIDCNASIAYNHRMSTTLTIRNLDESVKQLLRMQAASHGRSMEAEARDILTTTVKPPVITSTAALQTTRRPTSVCSTVRGMWAGRMSTDEIMTLTRGD